MTDLSMQTWVLIWLAAAVLILLRHWRSGVGAGLVFSYVLSFGAMHWLVPVLYLLPWFDTDRVGLTALGMRQSAIAMLAFLAGSEIAMGIVRRRLQMEPESGDAMPLVDNRIVNLYFIVGGLLYGIVLPVAGRLPSVTAIVSAGATLGVVAIGLKCWNAWWKHRSVMFWIWLAGTAMLPVVTVMGQGFLGYGFAAMLTVFAFVASFYRPRWQVMTVGLLLAYVGMSVYVTYMRDRDDIRAVVWSGSSVTDRVDQVVETFQATEWFSLESEAHLNRVDGRLNQNFLLGAAIVYIEGGSIEFASGATLWDALIAIVPRALWPDKPDVGGSGNLVADYTGFRFAEGTSVGIGQVMEAYVNFGTEGVVVVFLVIGGVLSLVDRWAFVRLRAGHASRFLLWYMPGLSFLQVGGSFMELTSTAAAGVAVALLLSRLSQSLYPDRRADARLVGDDAEAGGRQGVTP